MDYEVEVNGTNLPTNVLATYCIPTIGSIDAETKWRHRQPTTADETVIPSIQAHTKIEAGTLPLEIVVGFTSTNPLI